MAGRTDGLIKGFKASGAVGARLIVKPGASDELVAVGAAATDKLIGISTELPAADTEPCDVILGGIAEVIYGGNVTRGDQLTSDAAGKAVVPAPAAGANNRVIGIALVSGAANDIGVCKIGQGSVQG